VLLAQLWPAIAAAAMVALTLGIGEFVVTDALRSTDDTRTLAATFFNRDLTPRTYALGAALAAAGFISSALVFAALRIGRRGSPTQRRSARDGHLISETSWDPYRAGGGCESNGAPGSRSRRVGPDAEERTRGRDDAHPA
jgi:hypothetical protein